MVSGGLDASSAAGEPTLIVPPGVRERAVVGPRDEVRGERADAAERG